MSSRTPTAGAGAVPGRGSLERRAPAWSALAEHSRRRGPRTARVVLDGERLVAHSWAESAQEVEQAAAGLVRSGLRVDQVVVSLVAPGHHVGDIDLALHAAGAVVVHVDPHASSEHLARELGGVDVRLVVVDAVESLDRLGSLPLPGAELFALDSGRGWARLLELGSERLKMDPDAVARAGRTVRSVATEPRLLAAGRGLGRVPAHVLFGAHGLTEEDVVLVASAAADLSRHAARAEHLRSGAALCELPDGADVLAALEQLQPTVLVLDQAATAEIARHADAHGQRQRRGLLRRSPAGDARPPGALRVRLVATPTTADDELAWMRRAGIDVVAPPELPLLVPDLPVPPPVIIGDARDLPRRSRGAPGKDFVWAVDRGAVHATPPGPDDTAFVLPSLPLFGGESYLDRLLLARAEDLTS